MNNFQRSLYTPHQWKITQDIKRKCPDHIIFEGAIRSGKTFLAILYWVGFVSMFKGKKFIMTGYTISSLKRNVLDEINDLFGVDTTLNTNNEFEMFGNKICCFGTDKKDSFKALRGVTSQGWYGNEVTLQHINSINTAFGRCSEDNAKIIWETNPDVPTHHVKENFIDRANMQESDGTYPLCSYHFKLEDNDRLSSKYIERLKKSIPRGTAYDREILGLWRQTERAVYTNYEIVERLPVKIDDQAYGLDFGYVHPTCLTHIQYTDGDMYITPVFGKTKMTEKMFIEEMEKHVKDKDIPIYCDAAEPDKIQALRDNGFNAWEADKSPGSVIAGIRKCQGYRLKLVNGNIKFIKAVENYEFKERADGTKLEEPVKYNDDWPDSFRYPIYTHRWPDENFNVNDNYKVETYDLEELWEMK